MSYPCAYLSPMLDASGVVEAPRLEATTERHKVPIARPALTGRPIASFDLPSGVRGVVLEMWLGWPSRSHLAFASEALSRSLRVWLYWPNEGVVECLDRERIASYRRLAWFVAAAQAWFRAIALWNNTVIRAIDSAKYRTGLAIKRSKAWIRNSVPAHWIKARRSRRIVNAFFDHIAPVPFPFEHQPSPAQKIHGTGAYLRTDFWARIESGGSYGHTCYVAKELARVTDDFVCFMAHRFALIDEFGIRQVDMPAPHKVPSEDVIVEATRHYFPILREEFKANRPAYIYERLGLGSYAGALLSQEFKIPYIVEYNGSEISMRRSFDGSRYIYESVYLLTEELAFRQATMISVVSEEIKKTLLARGIPEAKILVNPNGADLDAYRPPAPEERRALRQELGLPPDGCVVGFTGTFGGWHGVDVLAAAIPRICDANPEVTFLLIGDGNFKYQVDETVTAHGLERRVISVGRVPQSEGARMLKACDIYVSPHSSHMVDSKFFGSPTKIFEYMAMGGGIVASNLEQIGVVLSPALTAAQLRDGATVGNERSVLCRPGDVDDFVEAVTLLSKRRDLCVQLGRNARQAVADNYSWEQHVSHLWKAGRAPAAGQIWGARWRPGKGMRKRWTDLLLFPPPPETEPVEEVLPERAARREPIDHQVTITTGDPYKDEVQRQWDNDPAGSHYATGATRHSLQWFREVEAYRYKEYAPWMAGVMEFARHPGEQVLEVGAGIGTDLAQFAEAGAFVTDLDLSSGHLALARENFERRGLNGEFVLHDAESLPFDDNRFDVVYSNGVIHHTPNTYAVVDEMYRVLKPGGRVIVMVYAENSLHYWRNLVWAIGIKDHELESWSMGDIMSRAVERSDNAAARPLVKVYTKPRLRNLFRKFGDISIVQRQMVSDEVPRLLSRVPVSQLGKIMGWNLIIKARKPLG